MTSLVRLYPPDWRARYEDEFLSLLAERPPDVRDRVDIVRGALDARLRPQVPKGPVEPIEEAPRTSISQRSLGGIVLAGAIVWLGALVVYLDGPIVVDGASSYRDGSAALPLTFLAFVLLGAGLVGVARSLPHGTDVGGLAAAVAAVTGATWALVPWVIWLLVAASIGFVVLAVTARRTRVWGVLDTSILVGGVALTWVLAVRAMLGIAVVTDFDAYVPFWIAMTSIWIAVGHALIAGRRSAAAEGFVEGA
jgi:hypothetical protein